MKRGIVVLEGADVASSLGDGILEGRLAAVGGSARVHREPAARFDVMVQRMQHDGEVPDVAVPADLRPWFAGHFVSGLKAPDVAVVVLGVRDELFADVWQHREQGWLVQPPPDLDESWSPDRRQWLHSFFTPTPRLAATASMAHLGRIGDLSAPDAVRVVFNLSTYEPVHDCAADSYSVAAHQIDLALEEAAGEQGFAVVDVDRIVAEFGGAGAVAAPGVYRPEACAVIGEEALRVIDGLGIPGLSLESDVMRLDVPAYDRRTTEACIDAWHVAPGSTVHRGDPLFDLTFRNMMHRLDYSAQETNRMMSATVVAAESGRIAAVEVPDGTMVRVGQPVAVVAKEGVDTPPSLARLESGTPPFRTGIRLR